MDIDFLRSISEDQTDMMMMQLEKLPDFSGVFGDDHKDHLSIDTFMDNQPTTNLNINIPNNYPILDQDLNFINPNSNTVSFTSQPQTTPAGGHEMQFLSSSRWRNGGDQVDHRKRNNMAAMREMIFRMAAMQPIHIDPESIKPPKRRNVKISKDPQSVAARHRRERISERIRILQRLVPGGTKMDTASMLDEAIHYLKFLKNQVQTLEKVGENRPPRIGFPVPMSSGSYIPIGASAKGYQQPEQNFHHQISL